LYESLITCKLHKILGLSTQGGHVARMRDDTKLSENLTEEDHSEELGVDRMDHSEIV